MTTSVLNELKTFNPERYDLDELVELCAAARSVRATYEHFALEEPEYFTNGLKLVERSVRDANRDALERTERLLEMEIESLKSRGDKLATRQEKLAAIKAKKAAAQA